MHWLLFNMPHLTLPVGFDILSESFLPSATYGPIAKKVVISLGNFDNFDPNRTTWLGGICSLATGDWEQIRKGEKNFSSVTHFSDWLKSWYPRIDQLHDAIGIPPRSCPGAVYVVEDSFFARRMAKATKLSEEELSFVFRQIHKEFGEKAVSRWLQNYGYQRGVRAVYTSELEKELEIALRIWERETGTGISPNRRDWAKVELMYMPVWLDILGLNFGIISEPVEHAQSTLKSPWRSERLYQIGYLPFHCALGSTRLLPLEPVTHRGNWKDFQVEERWSAINFAFNTKEPFAFSLEQMRARVQRDLAFVYGE